MPRYETSEMADLKGPADRDVVYLVDVVATHELKMLEAWVKREGRKGAPIVRIDPSRRGRGGDRQALDQLLTSPSDPHLIPLRVVWVAPDRDGHRSVGWSDIFKPGDPRDPYPIRARWIKLFHPSRVLLLAGQGATVSQLTALHLASDEIDGMAQSITRRAWLSLDYGERKLRGNRYKVPRFVHETLLSRRSFIESIHALADASGEDRQVAVKRASRYLKEIAANHSPYVIDLVANAIHYLYRQGYGAIEYRPDQLANVAELGQSYPVVFLPAHRSNLDRLSTQFVFWENDLPPNHTAGGINLNFFPIGPLLRRSGVFFIRRSFKDNDLYKLVLRTYIDFLIEKRFPIEWYLEGGRSRSGKLQAPRYGLLQYVVGSLRSGKADDVMVVPVSIVYDQIQDVADYTREAKGEGKEKESVRWMVKAIRSLRRRYGNIHVRFGEAISVAGVLADIDDGDEPSLGLQKLTFEVMHRIANATPITPTAVVSIALLEANGQALTAADLASKCLQLDRFIRARGLEYTEPVDLADESTLVGLLNGLAEHKAVLSHQAVGRTVYWLDDEQMIQVSYYRNMVVHYFVPRAIAEMALRACRERQVTNIADFEEITHQIRDLLKFEFFFAEREQFDAEIASDLAVDLPEWQKIFKRKGAAEVLDQLGEPVAHWALLPFLDGYQVVGDELESLNRSFDEKSFLKSCLDRSRMYRIENRRISGESASQVMFKSALSLAANRGLLDDGAEDARSRFAEEVRQARRLSAYEP